MKPVITAEQRRARLARRHRLDGGAPSALAAIEAVCVLHATDPATVFLSVLARSAPATIASIEAGLYDERSLVRMLAMRRTMFVVPMGLAPVVHAAASLEVATRIRRQMVSELGRLPTEPPLPKDIGAWLRRVEAGTERALTELGGATGTQLSAAEPRLRTAILPSTGKSWDVRRNVTTRLLTMMAAEGRMVRGRPRGDWRSRQHFWEPPDRWWPDGLPELPAAEARTELLRRYLAAFGPATVTDMQWWTGWTLGTTRKALADVDTAGVEVETGPALVLADDLKSEPEPKPCAALLPALDATPMGWKEREWFLGPHGKALFDTNGNIGPTVWWEGRIVGGWAVRPDGEVVWRALEDVGKSAVAAVDSAAERLHERLGGATVAASFPTPLEKDLRG
ncbi:MAG TPA: winged helix DNA-binding domain-containing protein [Jatrophihabitantaceae bacterium]|jgi:hypothetical protein|nr:winged helix DNA-binding domain-containing protein [Jatrophihabitantaceae bacterium]